MLAPGIVSFSLVLALAVGADDAAKRAEPSPAVTDPQNGFLAVQVAPNGLFNMGVNPTASPCVGPAFAVQIGSLVGDGIETG